LAQRSNQDFVCSWVNGSQIEDEVTPVASDEHRHLELRQSKETILPTCDPQHTRLDARSRRAAGADQ
jgi:hypothetical protein